MLVDIIRKGLADLFRQSLAAQPRLMALNSSKLNSSAGSLALGYTASRFTYTRSALPVFGFTTAGSRCGFCIARDSCARVV